MSSVVISGDTSGAITLAAPAVSGTNTATLPAATGTVMVSGNMPAFSAYASASQSLTTGTQTKVVFGTESFDTNNNFASNRFTPTVAGYYQINGCTNIQGSSAITRAFTSIWKNGSEFSRGVDVPAVVNATNVSNVIYLNGSTDYVELYTFATGTGLAVNFDTTAQYTYFSGSLVRS
jgi:hypothetical protein